MRPKALFTNLKIGLCSATPSAMCDLRVTLAMVRLHSYPIHPLLGENPAVGIEPTTPCLDSTCVGHYSTRPRGQLFLVSAFLIWSDFTCAVLFLSMCQIKSANSTQKRGVFFFENAQLFQKRDAFPPTFIAIQNMAILVLS